jgi:hypothetical protein
MISLNREKSPALSSILSLFKLELRYASSFVPSSQPMLFLSIKVDCYIEGYCHVSECTVWNHQGR